MSVVFTGIIQHVGSVLGVRSSAAGKVLRIDVGPLAEKLSPGASMAVDGACLTASGLSGTVADFDAVPETLGRSTLGGLGAGSKVNLEPALPAGGALDGHIVQGHVDGIAEVTRIETGAGGHVIHLSAEAALTDQMVPKGSVAVAGVSLTLVDVARGRFSVALVPTTLAKTTLGEARISNPLNVELDIIGKYVRRYLQQGAGGGSLTLEKLREEGFA
ncbi:MAG: riboflavin synthase [Planctomycetota bacterium]|jgi:riboflavin synthase